MPKGNKYTYQCFSHGGESPFHIGPSGNILIQPLGQHLDRINRDVRIGMVEETKDEGDRAPGDELTVELGGGGDGPKTLQGLVEVGLTGHKERRLLRVSLPELAVFCDRTFEDEGDAPGFLLSHTLANIFDRVDIFEELPLPRGKPIAKEASALLLLGPLSRLRDVSLRVGTGRVCAHVGIT
jgi:hypothetical protein